MFKMLIAGFLFLNATQAFGVARSEEWFQAEKGEMFSELSLGYSDTEIESSVLDTNYTLQDAFLSFEMGLTENVAWYSNVGYFMGEAESVDFEGTRALTTGLRMQKRFQSGRFISYIQVSHELESANAENQNGSVFSIAAGGGYEHFFEKELVGAYVSLPFLNSDFEGESGEPSEVKGVVGLSVYGETQRINALVLGVKANYRISGPNLQKDYRIEDGSGKFQVLTGSLYARYDITTKLSALANAGYLMSLEESDTDIDSLMGYEAGLGVRYKF